MSGHTDTSLSHNTLPGPIDTILSDDTLGSIEISGLAKANNGEYVALEIPRELPDPLSNDLNYPHRDRLQNREFPSSDGKKPALKLKLGELLGEGSCGWTYAVEVIPPPSGYTFTIPHPLVVKIAKQTEGRRISEEADVYDMLKPVQGKATAWCYGYFRRPVNLQELSITPWDPETTFPRSKETFDVHNMPHPCASLSILLLERLGKPLSETVDPSRPDSLRNIPEAVLREQLMQLCRDVYQCRIVHLDIKPSNILRASLNAPAPASSTDISSPVNLWRLVDWDQAQKVKWPLRYSEPYSFTIDGMMDLVVPKFYAYEDELQMEEEREAKKLEMTRLRKVGSSA
ncbi:uncharacterized protein TRAVEDRAFT_49167 [Trametes versicolor FP-101664 SS1]|uniref:uncharacterized protein n=1 Tax=Trametes versicolor (strain FP-101664) TaxID=717944 RepID=UPI0004622631|nr:uncharacterized protein TRAVEDRAFT_49167 [Trametes versicolor FP-101664 SS1]EIW56338.1 hypothetical protein TRAVEDRAFT_49167 [Trametes versicolor FP-101664 SS1]